MAANEKDPVLNRDNLTILIETQLCQKQNIFSEFFAKFLKSTISFKSCKKKGDPHRFCISDITDSEHVVR